MPQMCGGGGKCGYMVKVAGAARCTKCGTLFHKECAGLEEQKPMPRNWKCEACNSKGKAPGTIALTTPVTIASSTPVTPGKSLRTIEESQDTSLLSNHGSEILTEIRMLREEFTSNIHTLQEEVSSMRAEFRDRLAGMDVLIDTLSKRLDKLEEGAKTSSHPAMAALEEAVQSLQSSLHDRDQDLIMNDIQITNLPEAQGESVGHLVTTAAAKLGITVDERDIVYVERAGPRRVGDGRPRPITVRLARRATRDALLKASRVRREVNTAGMGFTGEPRRFYVNERLTRHNRHLFNRARELSKAADWKFTWTREGRVYVRQAEGRPAHRIRVDDDLQNIFKV